MTAKFPRIPGMPLKEQARMDNAIKQALSNSTQTEIEAKIARTRAFGGDPDFNPNEIAEITEEEK